MLNVPLHPYGKSFWVCASPYVSSENKSLRINLFFDDPQVLAQLCHDRGSNPNTSTYLCEFIMALSFRLSTKKNIVLWRISQREELSVIIMCFFPTCLCNLNHYLYPTRNAILRANDTQNWRITRVAVGVIIDLWWKSRGIVGVTPFNKQILRFRLAVICKNYHFLVI